MAFLPQEFSGAQEGTGTHFPANDIGPLVDQQRQISIRLDPVFVCIPDDGLLSGTHNQFFFQSGIRVHDQSAAVWIVF